MPKMPKENGWMTIAGWVVFAVGATLRAAASEAPGSPLDVVGPQLAEWILLAGIALAGVGSRRKDGKLMRLLKHLPVVRVSKPVAGPPRGGKR